MPLGEGFFPGRREKHITAAKELSALGEGSPVDQVFNLHFDLLRERDPHKLEVGLLGMAIISGVDAREKDGLRKVRTAIRIAKVAHGSQPRTHSDDPYINHPYRSAFLAIQLAENMGIPITSELIVGAVLHDAVEDRPEVTKDYLCRQFMRYGGDYADRVAEDSESLSRFTDGKKLDANEYATKIHTAATPTTLLRRLIIKTADRTDNLLDPAIAPPLDEENELRKARKKMIKKTQGDLLPILFVENPNMPVATDHLVAVLNRATDLSQATLETTEFDTKNWKQYVSDAA